MKKAVTVIILIAAIFAAYLGISSLLETTGTEDVYDTLGGAGKKPDIPPWVSPVQAPSVFKQAEGKAVKML